MSCHNLVAWSGESLFWIFFSYVKKLFDHEHVCPALIPKLIDENTGCSGGKEDSQQQQSTGLLDVVLFTVVFLLPTMLHLAFPPVLPVYNSP